MRSFLLGAPVEGSFNIPFKVERGESMKTITAISTTELAVEIKDCFSDSLPPNSMIILKSPNGGAYATNQWMAGVTNASGVLVNGGYRRTSATLYQAVNYTSTNAISVTSGDVYYVIPIE